MTAVFDFNGKECAEEVSDGKKWRVGWGKGVNIIRLSSNTPPPPPTAASISKSKITGWKNLSICQDPSWWMK